MEPCAFFIKNLLFSLCNMLECVGRILRIVADVTWELPLFH
ncbi:hypothetical protein J2T60_000327 [Natronospira proteinivora]|uniref:Uncharacterized protein n=1 Tax=Natronospira proteinivora TaxID=1807133 RepID=A0ABT1G4Y7_9GAMM|nr:hypothetical protein [Natronospira proteinivora]